MTKAATGDLSHHVVSAGEVVKFARAAAGRAVMEFTVLADCGNTDNGHWACEKHPKAWLRGGIAVYDHINSGKHRIVWVCHKHGPESVAFSD